MAIKFEPKAEQPKEEKTYKVKDTFLYKNRSPYIINRVNSNEVILSGITDGLRWTAPVKVGNDMKITQYEFDQLTGGASSDFIQKDFELKQI